MTNVNASELSIEEKERKGPAPVNRKAQLRLNRIEGQVRGLQRMVEEEKYCVDILTQISAVRAALKSTGMLILKRHVETCVADALEAGGADRAAIINELINVMSKELS